MLILDEPTEGIQPSVVAEIEAAITALTQRGDLGVLLVEQHIGFALESAQRYYILESGRVTSSGHRGFGVRGRCARRDGHLGLLGTLVNPGPLWYVLDQWTSPPDHC